MEHSSMYDFTTHLSIQPDSTLGTLITELQHTFSPELRVYKTWKQNRQSTPSTIPRTWQSFSIENPTRFMFLIETAHTIVSRTVLFHSIINSQQPTQRNTTYTIQQINTTIESVFPQLGFKTVYSWWVQHETDKVQVLINDLLSFSSSVCSKNTAHNDFLGELYQHMIDSDTRKQLGSFYTPTDIVDYMISQTQQTNHNTILDPSCGSGRFLTQFMGQWERDKINPIGIDIDPFAVFVSRVRYATQILDKTNTVPDTPIIIPVYQTDTLTQLMDSSPQTALTDYGNTKNTVTVTNSMTVSLPEQHIKSEPKKCYTIYKHVFELIHQTDGTQTVEDFVTHIETHHNIQISSDFYQSISQIKQSTNTLNTESYNQFVDCILGGIAKQFLRYDLIIGNPPYVNIKNIDSNKTATYREQYETTTGRFDLYIPFIEHGLDSLNKNGELLFITSNKFMRTNYGTLLRDKITNSYTINTIIDFGGVNVFADATTMTSIISISNTAPSNDSVVQFTKVINKNACDSYLDVISTDETNGVVHSSLPQSHLVEEEYWKLTSKRERNITETIESASITTLIDECIGIRQGVSSGCDDVFVVSQSTIDKYDLEEELLQELVFGRDVRRWKAKWDGKYAIYPYDSTGSLIDYTAYPNTKAYLEQHRELLEDRYCVREGNASIYEYDGPRHNSVYEGEWSIASPDIASHNNFADTNSYECFKNTVYVLTFDTETNYTKEMLLGVLNSPIVEFIVQQESPQLQGEQRRYKSQYLSHVPLPPVSNELHNLVEKHLQNECSEQDVFECVKELYNVSDTQYDFILQRTERDA